MVDIIKQNLSALEQTFIKQISEYVNCAIDKFNSSYEETEFNIEFDLGLETERGHNLIKLVQDAGCKKNLTLNLNNLTHDLALNKMALDKIHGGFKKLSQKTKKKISKLKHHFNKNLKLHKKTSGKFEQGTSGELSSDSKVELTSEFSNQSQQSNISSEQISLSGTAKHLTTEEESKLGDIALKNLRKEQVREIIQKAQEIIAEKDKFSEYFSDFLTTLENFKTDKVHIEKRMQRFINCLELSIEELQRKEQDFQQINDLIHMIRAIIDKENNHINQFIMQNFRNLYKGEFEDLCQFLSGAYINSMMKSDLTQFKARMSNLTVPRGIIATYKLIHHYYEQAGRRLFLREDQKKIILRQLQEQTRKEDWKIDKKAEEIKRQLEENYKTELSNNSQKLKKRNKKIEELKKEIKKIKKESNMNSTTVDDKLHQQENTISTLTIKLETTTAELNNKLDFIHNLEMDLKKEREYIFKKKKRVEEFQVPTEANKRGFGLSHQEKGGNRVRIRG